MKLKEVINRLSGVDSVALRFISDDPSKGVQCPPVDLNEKNIKYFMIFKDCEVWDLQFNSYLNDGAKINCIIRVII